ncbi:c-type cytochrome [Qipengyuania sp. 6B39]|uniref:c-type cytochrome n=1 Tax=Qipengyuania proteolytica TaxID=2867239 RepID=UPI001C8AD989|nr:c-type cytochrome [Qipengyuania proteolytica]MBX7494996.1 c-type cytochrome [Qipengyuania proteolytica]
MDDRFNTAAGWVLFAGIVALGSSIVSGMYFHADNSELAEGAEPGFFIEGEAEEAGAAGEMSFAEALNLANAADGEKVFAKCSACHTIDQGGANGIGPNLYGVMGTAIGAHAPGFAYSSALSGKGGTWDWDAMNAWLANPRAFADGTKMSFAGLPKIEDRAAVALYMNAQGSNLPVPEFVPAAAEEPAADAADTAGAGPGPAEGVPVDAVEAAGAMSADQPLPESAN